MRDDPGSPPRQRVMNATEWTLLLVLALLWGGSFFFGKVALAVVPPLTLVVLRTGVAALALLGFLAAASGMLIASTLVMLPVTFAVDSHRVLAGGLRASAAIWAAIGALALFSTAL